MTSVVPSVELRDRTLIVRGVVDAQSVVPLRQQGEALIRLAQARLDVDLAQLETAHSVVLSMLLCWQRVAGQSGSSLCFRHISDRLESLAALSNLDERLPGFEPV
ncbi:STAS domain-containing protein [Marinobacter salinisoli]|uniref:STAS domain-containing protein n=1 Tax=Marinobacter salinisoli TaxID=2769486 RepID=A0ABX7MQC5_9GAMM|nr:STAS domain-containing protein [Marinobacter salinisoli]QSP94521.1 STAS domain-containing protein [Marinobacter salinisoli]